MPEPKMFNLNDNLKREEKLKLLEVLLIIGGIVGGTKYTESMSYSLGLFIIFSLIYFLILTDKRFHDMKWIEVYAAVIVMGIASSFSVIVTGLFTVAKINSIGMFLATLIGLSGLATLLAILLIIVLYT